LKNKNTAEGISWVIKLIETEYLKHKRSKGVLSPKKKLTDKNIFICDTCDCAWEEVWWDGGKKIRRYSDFPKIGKEKKYCGCLRRLNGRKPS